MNLSRYHNKKLLRCGFTTGSCAAAAAKAAATALLTGHRVQAAAINTPAGIPLTLAVTELTYSREHARCAVVKDGGDDPDVTTGMQVFADVSFCDNGITIDGGEGVGRITKPGLDQPVGAAAINKIPRAMILREVTEVCEAEGYGGGLSVVISIPGGAELARRTFNPRMGIVGGLSVLGTSGIVEPMSDKAVIDTIRLELNMLAATGRREVLLTLGNYGSAFAEKVLKMKAQIKCSNFLGDALDSAVQSGFTQILVAGHIGKLVKLGIGVTDTHSSRGDGRIETLIACALRAGAPVEVLRELDCCVTTDAALGILRQFRMLSNTMAELGASIGQTLSGRVPETVEVGFICFSGDDILVQSENAKGMCEKWYIL